MTPTDKLILREQLLLTLQAASRLGLPLRTLRAAAFQAGFELDATALTAELAYLVDKGLAAERRSALSQGDLRYTITADGTDYLEAQGRA